MSFIYEGRADGVGYIMLDRYTREKHHEYNPTPHLHNSLEMILVERGEYSVCINGEERRLCTGEAAVIDVLTPHTAGLLSASEDFSVWAIVISPEYLGSVSFIENRALPRYIQLGNTSEGVFSLLGGFARYGKHLESASAALRCGFVLMLLGILESEFGTVARADKRRREILCEIISFVGSHYTENITLEGLAERYGYEKTYLSRLINGSLGMNLREYLNRLRVAAVITKKRENPEASLYSIAEECGFVSQNTFYRAYKRYAKNTTFDSD
jgi:AraC-like DNA-binding protein